MKFSAATFLSLALIAQSASAHYIFNVLIAGSKTSTEAVRQPKSVDPFHDITSSSATCNVNPSAAGETVTIAAGDTIGFGLSTAMYHQGPVAIYLGKAPTTAASWDGSGANWFKIKEWGVETFKPVNFSSHGLTDFTATLPKNTPPGEYLARIEQLALHLGTGVPEIFVSCAQIKVTGSGTGTPSKVSIPGYIAANDPEVIVDIYDNFTSYTVPGPKVWSG